MSNEIIHVAVAVIRNKKNQVLISKRPDDVHLGGYWEFPGGKIEADETIEDALEREIKEELDIQISQYRPLIKITHHYKNKSVLLDVWNVSHYFGVAKGNEDQLISWKMSDELDAKAFPEADIPIIRAINLPECCLITGVFKSESEFITRLELAINNGIKLVQCRLTHEQVSAIGLDSTKNIIEIAESLCKKSGVLFVLNCHDEIESSGVGNVHLNSKKLMTCEQRPVCNLLSASCHNADELLKASELGVDFVYLSAVKATNSHPEAIPLGWEKFSELVKQVNIPVYALGGVGENDLTDAWGAGAQGIAGIGDFWKSL